MSVPSCPITQIVKRNGTLVPYDRDRIATAIFKAASAIGREDRPMAEKLADTVEQVLIDTYSPDSIPTVEDIQDVVESTLMREGHIDIARDYIIYRHEHARLREERRFTVEASDNIPYKKIYEVLRWNMDNKCHTVDEINATIENGSFPGLVRACDKRYHEEVGTGADTIIERLPNVRIVVIAGPSSSGKTTTTIKVSEKLKMAGKRFKALAVDHYFFDLEMHPKDEFGDYDYETPHALDLELISQHLAALLAGETVLIPDYNFKTGKRTLNVHKMRLEDDEILLIDSLHGLYADMTASIPSDQVFRLYVETLGQVHNNQGVFMRWADNRLMRRMIRDSWHRNLQPAETLTHWHYVRRSELQNIIPFIGTVDYLVNSAMPYELPILKHRLFRYFPEAMERYKDNPKRRDAFIRAQRVYDFLNPMKVVVDDGCIPPNSLLREFIGGSEYTY